MYKTASQQKDKIERWTLGAMNALPTLMGEYHSVNAAGDNITPASNEVTFVLGTNEKTMETVLTEAQAAVYTRDYTLGAWSAEAAAAAQQAECEKQAADLEPDAIYMAETEGQFVMLLKGSEFFDKLALYDGKTYTLRKANARGGFGEPAEQGGDETAIETVSSDRLSLNTRKQFRNGQLIILHNGKTYNALGQPLP